MPDREAAQSLFQRASREAQAGSLRQARASCEQALELEPANPAGLQLMATICWHLGDAQQAQLMLRQSLAANPHQPGAWYELGNMLDAQQQDAAALDAFERAVQHDPGFADAWLKLGIKQAETGHLQQAQHSLQQTLKLRPGDIRAFYTLGQVREDSDDTAGAMECYQQALVVEPDNAHLLHSLGIVYRRRDCREQALECYAKALAVDSQNPRLWQSQGHVLSELGRIDEARRSYQHSLQLQPDALDVHDCLNNLYWQYGMHEHYLQSYPVAIQSQPHSLALRLHYAEALSQVAEWDAAAEVLNRAQQEIGSQAASDPALHRLSGQILASKGLIEQAQRSFTTAISLAPMDIRSREAIARLLIVEEQYPQALEHIEAVAGHSPLNQSLIAYRSLCWRLLGDPREASVNDYQHFIKAYKIALPPGYRNHREFNLAVNQCLDELHNTRVHPLGQTLREGTQTQGNLFNRKSREIQEVRQSIEQSVREYIDSLERQAGHPLLGRKSAHFRFSDSWSCRLSEQGYHTNHIHPQGWISSCYYVSLPQAVHTSEDQQGWIKFGETNLKLGSRERVARCIQPQEGLLVLFPSYMFHGTVPFSSAETRTTIAFDVVPHE